MATATTFISEEPDVAMKGNLFYHPKRQIFKKNKEYHAILFKRSAMGHARLELFEKEKDVIKGSHTLMVVCSDVMKVKKIPDMHDADNKSFVLSMKDQQQHTFSAANTILCDVWLKALQDTIFQPTDVNYNVQKPQGEQVTDINDIYLPAEELWREFTVTPDAVTRKKLKADGQLRLLVENGHITLISKDNNRLTRFGIEHLRRLGYSDENFHIEAGRKTECGEGDYTFLTKMGKRIHTLVNIEKENWRRQTNGQTRGPTLPPGQVLLPNLPQDEPSNLRNHEYEDVSQWMNFSNPKTRLSQKLQQPPPPSSITPTGVKSQPTAARGGARNLNQGNKQPSLELQSQLSNNFKAYYPDDANIYDEPVIQSEAWKNFGRDEEDDENPSVNNEFSHSGPEENTYDNLTRFKRSVSKAQESPYDLGAASGRPEAEGAYMEAVRMMDKKVQPQATTQQPEECIYSQVNLSMKMKNRK